MREATNVRDLFVAPTSSARQLIDAINNDADWSRAVPLAPKVSSLLEALRLGPDEQNIMYCGMHDVRKQMVDDASLNALLNINVGVGEAIKTLDLEVRRLKVMHASQKSLRRLAPALAQGLWRHLRPRLFNEFVAIKV